MNVTSLVYSLQPDIASAFLRRHIFDTSREDLVRAIDDLVADGDEAALDDFARAAIALESTLDRSMPSDQLISMVAFDGNVGLEDATEEASRAWLEELVSDLRRHLGRFAPPPRGTHTLDRDR